MEPLYHIMIPFNTIFTHQSNLSSFIRCSLICDDYEGIQILIIQLLQFPSLSKGHTDHLLPDLLLYASCSVFTQCKC